jgi:small conductance mechanosensitive channel
MSSLLETTLEITPESVLSAVISWCLDTGLKILIAIVLLLVSYRIINVISRKIEARGGKGKLDKTVAKVFAYVFKIGLKIAIAISLVAYLGFDTSGLTALVASLGVGIGLAVNGALSNLAGGVLILVTRPFKVDDFIDAQGVSGTVEDIRIVCTKLRTPDNKVVYVPNGSLANGNIINYSEKDTRRVDFSFEISYSANFEVAKRIVSSILTSHPLVLDEPAIFVRVGSHGQSSIGVTARAWTKTEDYWTVHFDVMETVKAEFDKHGIEIPYSQLDVHIKND